MIVTDRCEMLLLMQAEFDGELDAAQAAQFEMHRAQCPVCQAAEAGLRRVRELVGSGLYQPAPDAVRRRVMARLDAVWPRALAPSLMSRFNWWRQWWRQSAIGFGVGAACTAALSLVVLSPAEQSLTEQVIAGHVRALQPGHLEDVVSTDQHTVKPWFDGRIDFAPPVKDPALFPLKGGRLDYIDGRPVAALVYQRDKHVINLFVWPAGGTAVSAPQPTERHGYNVVHWSQNGMELWAVSDVGRDQLRDFATDWQRSP
jgi:anti-sigma factor RsiW